MKRKIPARVERRIDVDQVDLALELRQERGQDVLLVPPDQPVAPGLSLSAKRLRSRSCADSFTVSTVWNGSATLTGPTRFPLASYFPSQTSSAIPNTMTQEGRRLQSANVRPTTSARLRYSQHVADPTEPTIPPDALIRYQRFVKEQHESLRKAKQDHPELLPLDPLLLATMVGKLADDRLTFAHEHLKVADDLLGLVNGTLPTASARFVLGTALGRAYYAIFHALRALHLTYKGWDTDTHNGTISGTQSILDTEPPLQTFLDPRKDLVRLVQKLMDDRHVADYHMYGRENLAKAETDFAVAAPQAVLFAQSLLPQIAQAIEKHRRKEL